MNEIGILLLWCALQATLYLVVGSLLYAVMRRFGPAPGASAAASTLVALCCISAAAFSPWPRWWTLADGNTTRTAHDSPPNVASHQTDGAPANAAANTNLTTPAIDKKQQAGATTFNDYWQLFRAELQAARTSDLQAGSRRRWPSIAGALLVAGALLAMARFLVGLAALRHYRGRLLPLIDSRLLELAQSLARQMGCRRPIELKQSNSLTTPATMGWRRPVIILPADWQTWTDDERRVVLSHELAHVARGDYLAWLLAQVSVALHVYHPLVHWLSGRLRLEQELAADAWAAEMSGGRETYLFTLARMALRQDDRRIAWATRPFLPSRGTLLRRIEMLSETKPLRNVPVSRRRGVALAAVVVLVGLLVAGVRGPIGDVPRTARAAPPQKPRAAGLFAGGGGAGLVASEAIDLAFVPPRAVAVLAVRPAQLLSNPDMQALVKLLNETMGLEKRTGLKIENIEEVKLAITRLPAPDQPFRPEDSMLQILRYKEPFDWKSKFEENLVGKPVEATIGGKTYYHSDHGDQAIRPAFYLPDDRTIVIGPEIDLQRAIISAGKSKPEWAAEWERSATGQAAAMVDLTAVNRAIGEDLKRHSQQTAALFAPIWEKGQRLFVSVQSQAGLAISATIDCTNPEDANRVEGTIQAALTLARNILDEADRNLAKGPAAQAAALVPLIDLANEVLKQGKLQTEAGAVRYTTKLDLDVAETAVAVVTPAVIAAREAARRAQDANNMKQIMLALHNYHDVYGHFPPPVVVGPDGKTPHSWRLAILPFIEGKPLYDQYKLDEPWDSENNKRVLEQMPPSLRDPAADAGSKETSYFALVGPTTAFGEREGKGTQFPAITDGMSNTIAIVEAKRSVPWTKPEDIDYDPAKPLPKLGGWHAGGYFAGFCDGSVRFLAETLDQQTLRAMITKAGGELVPPQ